MTFLSVENYMVSVVCYWCGLYCKSSFVFFSFQLPNGQ